MDRVVGVDRSERPWAHRSNHDREGQHSDGGTYEKSLHPNLHLVVVPDRSPACFDKVKGYGDGPTMNT